MYRENWKLKGVEWHWVRFPTTFNTLGPRQHGRHFADDIFRCIFLNENVWIPIKISLKFVPKGPVNNIPALVQIMAWRRPGDKPSSEPMMVSSPTHICVARPQWVLINWFPACAAHMRLNGVINGLANVLLPVRCQTIIEPLLSSCQSYPMGWISIKKIRNNHLLSVILAPICPRGDQFECPSTIDYGSWICGGYVPKMPQWIGVYVLHQLNK